MPVRLQHRLETLPAEIAALTRAAHDADRRVQVAAVAVEARDLRLADRAEAIAGLTTAASRANWIAERRDGDPSYVEAAAKLDAAERTAEDAWIAATLARDCFEVAKLMYAREGAARRDPM